MTFFPVSVDELKYDKNRIFTRLKLRADPNTNAYAESIFPQLVELLRRMIPTYHSPEEVNRAAEEHLHAEDRQMSFLDAEEQAWHETAACSQR